MSSSAPSEQDFTEPFPDLNGKQILVTGGTGSFGQAFIKEVIKRWEPRKLIVFSRDENKQWEMSAKHPMERHDFMRYFIGDVRDLNRLEMAMRDVDYIIHAAALKHVPTAEYNPFECINTNVIGAENIVTAALRCNVKKVISLSTDKAVNPINLYGASKLASDKIFIAANSLAGFLPTRFSIVRYGNVLASRGSVIQSFRRLISEGASSLPITDPKMTRFWITVEQGVALVLSSLEMMSGGEIFVPKIPSMRTVDIAKALAPDLDHHVVGIRPGEKLHEILITEDDSRTTYELNDRYIIQPQLANFDRQKAAWKDAKKVANDFCYSSDANTEWLDNEKLQKILASTGANES